MNHPHDDPANPKPVLLVIAGPNGAGKTTFAKEFLPEYGILEFLNADYIAAGLSPLQPASGAFAAGRLLLERWDSLIAERVSFAIESTLSGKTYLNRIAAARSAGYKVIIAYLWLPTVNISLRRIRQRVRMGGHNVPEEDVRRRFSASLVQFHDHYLALAHRAILWDVGSNPARMIVEWDNRCGHQTIFNSTRYEIIKKQLKNFRKT